MLGHRNIKTTQNHYAPWVRDRQLRLEADLQRAWNTDPLVRQEVEPKSHPRLAKLKGSSQIVFASNPFRLCAPIETPETLKTPKEKKPEYVEATRRDKKLN